PHFLNAEQWLTRLPGLPADDSTSSALRYAETTQTPASSLSAMITHLGGFGSNSAVPLACRHCRPAMAREADEPQIGPGGRSRQSPTKRECCCQSGGAAVKRSTARPRGPHAEVFASSPRGTRVC